MALEDFNIKELSVLMAEYESEYQRDPQEFMAKFKDEGL